MSASTDARGRHGFSCSLLSFPDRVFARSARTGVRARRTCASVTNILHRVCDSVPLVLTVALRLCEAVAVEVLRRVRRGHHRVEEGEMLDRRTRMVTWRSPIESGIDQYLLAAAIDPSDTLPLCYWRSKEYGTVEEMHVTRTGDRPDRGETRGVEG